MPTINVQIPALGESVTEATLIKWHKNDGDFVKTDEPICELETDKANADLPSPGSGVIKRLKPRARRCASATRLRHWIRRARTQSRRQRRRLLKEKRPASRRARRRRRRRHRGRPLREFRRLGPLK